VATRQRRLIYCRDAFLDKVHEERLQLSVRVWCGSPTRTLVWSF